MPSMLGLETSAPARMGRPASPDSFACRGESTIDHTMVVDSDILTMERPDANSPFSDWEAYIVKQTQSQNPAQTPHPYASLSPRFDQAKRPLSTTQPLAYTKSRDRAAALPHTSPLARPLEILRSASIDLARNSRGSFERTRSPPPPPAVAPMIISSPIMSSPSSTLRSFPASPALGLQPLPEILQETQPLRLHAPKAIRSHSGSVEPFASSSRISTALSESPSLPSLSFSPFSSDSSSDYSSIDRRSSNSSGRTSGVSSTAAQISHPTAPASVASSYSTHSRRSSWDSTAGASQHTSSFAVEHEHVGNEEGHTFLQEFGIHHDSEESDVDHGPEQEYNYPIFQLIEAEPLDGEDPDQSGANTPLKLDLSSLPREKDDARKMRSKLVSPLSLSFRKKGSKTSPKLGGLSLRRGSGSSADSGSRTSSEQPSNVQRQQDMPVVQIEPATEPMASPTSDLLSPLPLFEAREKTPSILSASSSTGSSRGKRDRRLSAEGVAATLDPLLARTSVRVRSGSVLSNSSSTSSTRRGGRRSARSRITDNMPTLDEYGIASATLSPAGLHARRPSLNRGSSNESSSFDEHSNASSFNKVAGSDDSLAMPRPFVVKSVLKKTQLSVGSHLASHKKEVSFELPDETGSIRINSPEFASEETELEHELKQREMLKLPQMKLQAIDEVVTEVSSTNSTDNAEIASYLSSFGKDLVGARSSELMETFAGASLHDWPVRQDWESLTAYLMACATALGSRYNDDGAAQIFTLATEQRTIGSDARCLPQLVATTLRGAIGWERSAISAGAAAAYMYSLYSGSPLLFVLSVPAIYMASQGMSSSDKFNNQASAVILGSTEIRQRVKNLFLSRSPRSSLRCVLMLTGAVFVAACFSSVLRVAGLLAGFALFVWIPIVMQQPDWAPALLKDTTPLEALLYDVPNDAQYAMVQMRKRACNGDRIETPTTTTVVPHISPAIFENRLAYEDLQSPGNVLDGAYAASFEGNQGHLFVLPTRVLFRTSMTATFKEQLTTPHASSGGRVMFEARMDKVTSLSKVAAQQGLILGTKSGASFTLEDVQMRDTAFNKILAIAPQKWTLSHM